MDLVALALHESYTASSGVIIGDGTGLSITNIGSFTLPSLPTPLLFTNVLHVSVMSKNLISVSALCVDNPVKVMFFDSFFQVQDRHSGVTLGCGQRRDVVYYWSKSVPLRSSTIVLSSSVHSSFSAISMWHSRLGHPSLHIFRKFLSVLNISFPNDHLCSFSYTSCNTNKSHKLPFVQSSITFSLLFMSFSLMFGPHPFHLLMVFTTMLFLLTITQSIFGFTYYVENQMFIQPLLL